MNGQNISELTTELRDLLLQERDLLRAGNAAQSAGLVDRKLELMKALNPIMESLSGSGPGIPQAQIAVLSDIQKLATENAMHFDSVRNGLRSLIERLDKTSESTRIGTYDQHGNQMKFNRGEGVYRKSV